MIARPSFLAAFLVVLMMFAASSCSANMVTPSGAVGVEFGTNSVRMVDGVSDFARLTGRSVGPSVMNGSSDFSRLLAREVYSARVGGNSIAVAATRGISAGSVAVSAVALGASAWAGWQIGSAIADSLGLTPTSPGVRCFPTANGWQCDLGSQPNEEPGLSAQFFHPWLGTGMQTFSGTGAGDICLKIHSAVIASAPESGWSSGGTAVEPRSTPNWWQCTTTSLYMGREYVSTYTITPAVVQSCPPSVDALNPAYSVIGKGQPDVDGKCRTGRYNSAPEDTVAKRIRDYGRPEALPRLAEEVLSKGGSIEADGPRSLSGPSSVKGEPTTKTETTSDGKVRTETRTPSTNYTYAGDKITYNVSYTTIINNDGDVTTVEEGGPGVAQDGETDCEKFPEIVGCSKYGDIPTNEPPWESKDIPFEAVDLGFGGSCPPPTTWVLPRSGFSLTWSYQPACDVAPMVRAALLAITALGALIYIVRTVKP